MSKPNLTTAPIPPVELFVTGQGVKVVIPDLEYTLSLIGDLANVVAPAPATKEKAA